MNKRNRATVWACAILGSLMCHCGTTKAQNDKIKPNDGERAKIMLADVRDAVKKNYSIRKNG
jgi:hypothetical protein